MGAKCSSGYELGEILLRFVVPFFRRKHENFLVGGRGWVKKTFEQSALFSQNLVKNQLEIKKLSIDHSIVRYLLKCSFHAIFPQVRKHKKNNWEPRDIRTGNLTLVVHFLLAGRKNLHATWGQMGSNRIKCNWQPVLGMCALGDRSVPVAPEDSLTKPRFGVTSAEVVINCPGEWSQVVSNFLKNKQTNMSRISSNSSPPSWMNDICVNIQLTRETSKKNKLATSFYPTQPPSSSNCGWPALTYHLHCFDMLGMACQTQWCCTERAPAMDAAMAMIHNLGYWW